MEHPCHQCGATVEEGTPFCKQCGAPQIRVDADAGATPPLPPGTPGQLQPPAQPVPLAPGQAPPGRIDWSRAFPAALIAGVLLAVCWIVPWATFCLWTIAGGALAVALYQRRRPAPVTTGMGARLGAVTGLLGFVVFALAVSLEILATRGGRLRAALTQVFEQAAARDSNPAAQEMIQKLSSPQGIALLVTIGLIVLLAAFLIFSAIGGAIGAALFRTREK